MSELSNNGAGDHEATGRPVQGAGGDRKRSDSRRLELTAPKFTAVQGPRAGLEARQVGALLRREGLYSWSVWPSAPHVMQLTLPSCHP